MNFEKTTPTRRRVGKGRVSGWEGKIKKRRQILLGTGASFAATAEEIRGE